MRRMFKDFMKMFADCSDSDDSLSDEDKKKRREQNMRKRPACIDKPEGVLEYKPSEFAFLDVTVQNQTRWPCPLRSIAKVGGSEEIHFEPVSVDHKLRHEDEAKITIPVQMPAKPGDYEASFVFYGNKGTETGEQITFSFKVAEADASTL